MKNIQGRSPHAKKPHTRKTNWIILGGLGGAVCLILAVVAGIYLVSLSGKGPEGAWFSQKQTGVGTPIVRDPLNVLVTGVRTTTALSQDSSSVALNAFRVLVYGEITCTLPAEESCRLDEIEAELIPSSSWGPVYLDWPNSSSENQTIQGGSTIAFEVSSAFIDLDEREIINGAKIRFRISLAGERKSSTFIFTAPSE